MSENTLITLKYLGICVILGLFLCWVGGSFSEHTYVGEIVVYIVIEGPYLHTTLELKTYSGSSVTVQFEGTLELNVGDVIKISTKWNPTHCFASVTNYETIQT